MPQWNSRERWQSDFTKTKFTKRKKSTYENFKKKTIPTHNTGSKIKINVLYLNQIRTPIRKKHFLLNLQ